MRFLQEGNHNMTNKQAYIFAVAIIIASIILSHGLISLGESLERMGDLIRLGMI